MYKIFILVIGVIAGALAIHFAMKKEKGMAIVFTAILAVLAFAVCFGNLVQ